MFLTDLAKIDREFLGLNRRNQEYVRVYNPLSARIIADNKILTKRVLAKIGIQTPQLYKVVRTKKQLEFLDWESLPKSFVIKPNQGTGGNGIIVFYGKKKGKFEWIRPNGSTMDNRDIMLHLESITEGRFSMGNRNDAAIIEERIKMDPLLKQYSYKGVPDVRIIVFNNIPVMAMLRLPTRKSNGTANLHSGAICVGLDIASGVTTNAMYMNKSPLIEDTYITTEETIDLDNNLPLPGLKVPYWEKILEIAVKCQIASGVGYIGVDIAIDAEKGPMVLELNARPGLGIQVANRAGLRARLERVKGIDVKSLKHGIRVAKNLFGGVVEEEIEHISGKQVVNLVEKIYLTHKPKTKGKKRTKVVVKKESARAMMDTGILTSRIDKGLASRIGYMEARKHFESFDIPKKFESFEQAQEFIDKNNNIISEHEDIVRLAKIIEDGKIVVSPVIVVEVKLGNEPERIEMVLSSQTSMLYPVLIGRRELRGYLIDTSKTFTK